MSTDLPLITAYVDLTPELDAERAPRRRSSDAPLKSCAVRKRRIPACSARVTLMRDLLQEKGGLFGVRGAERDSFDQDQTRILEYLEQSEFDNASQGVVIFACAGEDLWGGAGTGGRCPNADLC
jgi:hypothetical protein